MSKDDTQTQPAAQNADQASKKAGVPDPIKLKYPFTNGKGETIDTITFRRGFVKDLKLAQRNAAGNADDVDLWLTVILSKEDIVYEDVERLDLADWADVQACLQGLV